MPQNYAVANRNWERYSYARDSGHLRFVEKANKCDAYVGGEQWNTADLEKLREARRPALTLNKTLITLQSILGEQIDTATETSFKARYGAPPGNAATLTKLYRFTSDINQLQWVRNEVFSDGAVTSRGFYDMRMNFDRNTTGDVELGVLNPKNVIPDPDAEEYDADKWSDVIITKWMTPDQIALMYNQEDADQLKARSESGWAYGYDSIDTVRDRFGFRGEGTTAQAITGSFANQSRIIRTIDRQYRVLTRLKYLVNRKTGDKAVIPDEWDRDRIALVLQQQPDLVVDEQPGLRIRWTVSADINVLHDDWSPYKHFTVVPYFPFFRYGRAIGLVESWLDAQELLNKSTSQELHIVNTTANSGYIVKANTLVNMQLDELEQRGAESGLVIEVNGDVDKSIMKIQPNQIPTGLDRLSFKAEAYIKAISGRGDNQLGLPRPDQSGKLSEQANQSSDVTLRKSFSNLERTDWMLARNWLDLVQEYYTDGRIMTITHNALTGDEETFGINQGGPDGQILYDLTLGSYDSTIETTPAKRTLEDSQFQQALEMRKEGIQVPDEFLIENSNLLKKGDIIKAMRAQKASPEAQQAQEIQVLGAKLELSELRGKTAREEADALLKRAKTEKELAEVQKLANEAAGGDAEIEREDRKHAGEMQRDKEKHEQKLEQNRQVHEQDMALRVKEAADKSRMMKAQAIATERQAAAKPAEKQAA